MNIFENYTQLITELVKKNKSKLKIKEINNFIGVTTENPPSNFDFDLSTNISLILAKINKLNPRELSNEIKELLMKELNDFSSIEVAGPGFLNLKFILTICN